MTEYSAREVSVLVGSNLFEIGTYLLIAGGGTIALMAFCGCCGTMREDRCVLAFVSIETSNDPDHEIFILTEYASSEDFMCGSRGMGRASGYPLKNHKQYRVS